MDIVFFGHACFKLSSSSVGLGGKKPILVTDPYGDKVGFKLPRINADIVTLSHDHFDHNNVGRVDGARRVITGPGEYEIMGVSIIGISTFHDEKKGKERGKNIVYIIEMDGLRVVHLGDLGHALTEKQVDNIGEVDVLMIPVGGKYTIDAQRAIEVVQSLEPKIAIPMHFALVGLAENLAKELSSVEPFLTHSGLAAEKTNKLSIKKSTLGEEQKIVIFERRSKN